MSERTPIREVFLAASLFWALFMFLIVVLTPYLELGDLRMDTELAIASALCCLLITWLVSRMPRNVLVYQKGIFIRKSLILNTSISSASIESVVIKGKSYLELRFCTNDGRDHKVALSRSVDSVRLAKFLDASSIGRSKS